MPSSSSCNCVVYGCSNSQVNTKNKEPKISFYQFSTRPWKQEQMKLWSSFVKRKGPNGKPWTPSKYSKICSVHFIGNSKSEDAQSPSYNPTIHPIKKRAHNIITKQDRFKRLKLRNKIKTLPHQHETPLDDLPIEQDNEDNHEIQDVIIPKILVDATTQTTDKSNNSSMSVFMSSTLNNDSSTQVSHQMCLEDVIIPKILVDATTQTTNKSNNSSMSVFISSTLNNDSSTQVSHQMCLETADVGSGCENRSPVFFGYDSVKDSDKSMKDLTGVSRNIFSVLLMLLPTSSAVNELSWENKLLLFLMKLKTNLTYTALGTLFNVFPSTASSNFVKVLKIIVKSTENWIIWPSRKAIQLTMPESFKHDFSSCRGIIDCSEVKTERPPGVSNQVKMWSNYKGTWTIKFLLCITPAGLISFVSKAYGGRTSDAFITNQSGLLEKFENGDIILADKGFPHVQVKEGTVLVMPPFSNKNQNQFQPEEMDSTFKIASVRIHVERSIQRLKIFNILENRLTIDLLPHIDDILHVCVLLTNFGVPIIRDVAS